LNRKLKLTGGKILKSPIGDTTRPTTSLIREAIINILRNKLEDSHWLDLCSGSGIMGCEALQMGARRIVSIESNRETAKICKSNLMATALTISHINSVEIFSTEVVKFLEKGCKYQSINFIKKFPSYDFRFDFIYIDPPYKSSLYKLILENILIGDWIKKDGIAICEHSVRDIPTIPNNWINLSQREYGNTGLMFLTPNQAFHYRDDTGSKLQQIIQE
tara:strand:+ start:1637 stop:2290 length:654 start_codon:yes stop_codon:yes gene_type:complete